MSDDKLYKSIVIEIRPKLQSVNVFISFFNSNLNNIKVLLNDNGFQINVDDQHLNIPCQNVSVKQNSLSSFKIEENFVSFRFATVNNTMDFGSFKAEIISIESESKNSASKKQIPSKENVYNLKCGNCKNQISKSNLKFDRILPLPSDNLDPSEWFCHAHNGQNKNLDPQEKDIFYKNCYVHLNSSIFLNIKQSGKLLLCRFCFNWLGVENSKDVYKIWYNTVLFLSNDSSTLTNPLTDSFNTVEEAIKTSLFNSLKVILHCQTASKDSNYILFWILEKQLNIIYDANTSDLKQCNVAKVLFKFLENKDELVGQWENDTMVQSISISKPMLIDMIKHLHFHNKLFPKQYRMSNNFSISYLVMYN